VGFAAMYVGEHAIPAALVFGHVLTQTVSSNIALMI